MIIDELLDAFTPEVQIQTRALCALIRDMVVEAEERVYPGWRGIGYRHPVRGYVFGVFPQRDTVRLLFEHGVPLADPDQELLGSGSQTRYLEFDPHLPLPEETIARFIGRALAS